jgi:GNAT superfamily N-acetyltransferase
MLTIRPIETSDALEWRRLWAAYLAFYETSRPASVFDSAFARLLDPVEPVWGLLAIHDGAAIGLVHCIRHRHNWSVEDVCYLQDLYVDDTARGSGAGRALIEAVYARADADGLANVYWLTDAGNAQARMLYDRIGVLTPFVKYQRR